MAGSANPLNWNILARIILGAFALSSVLFLPDFFEHAAAHFTGSIAGSMITDQWLVVVLNIIIFISFLVPLSFRRKADWKEYGLVVAFFVSLFIEMYGIPFILLGVSTRLAPDAVADISTPLVIDFLGVSFAFSIPMIYGAVLMTAGMALIMIGWYQLYKGVEKSELVTTGIYAVSRNPQYLGFMMIIVGWLIGWPTILVMIFAPILLFMYYRLCKVEEKEVGDLPGFEEYRSSVPLIV